MTLPPLPIPKGAIAFSPKERERIAAYMTAIHSLERELVIHKRGLSDMVSTAIERAGGDSEKDWALSADQSCAIPREATLMPLKKVADEGANGANKTVT